MSLVMSLHLQMYLMMVGKILILADHRHHLTSQRESFSMKKGCDLVYKKRVKRERRESYLDSSDVDKEEVGPRLLMCPGREVEVEDLFGVGRGHLCPVEEEPLHGTPRAPPVRYLSCPVGTPRAP